MEILSKQQFIMELDDVEALFTERMIAEEEEAYRKPHFGEIWICEVPVLVVDQTEVTFVKMKRPILVVDDGEQHFVRKDLKNYYGLKITSQEDVYQRKKIVNYRAVGLHKPSFIRLEIPMKLEKAQFCYYVGMYGLEKTQKILEEIRKRIRKQMPNEEVKVCQTRK